MRFCELSNFTFAHNLPTCLCVCVCVYMSCVMCLSVSESLQLLLSCRHITDGVFGGRRRGGDPVVPVASHPGRGL